MTRAISTTGPAPREPSPVARRRVFYLAGFDPRGARHYHELYRTETAKQAALKGARIAVGQRRTASPHSVAWPVQALYGDADVATEIEFLRWDDVVRNHWPRGGMATTVAILGSYWYLLRTGVLARILGASWPFFNTASYGFALVAAVLLAAGAAGWGVALAVGLPAWAAAFAGAAAALAAATQITRTEPALNGLWLGRTAAFVVAEARSRLPDYAARKQLFAERIVAAAHAGGGDEILVVGHSIGTQTAVSVLAAALRLDAELATHGPRIALLTLGSTNPLLAFCPHAVRFRDDLALVAASTVTWVDIGAPPDPACFALVDPLVAAGLRAETRPGDKPKLLSPRFMKILSPATYRAMRRDRLRLHFQYLAANELPGDYDYFAITAGPLTLAGRTAATPSVTAFRGLALFRR